MLNISTLSHGSEGSMAFVWWRIALMIILIKNEFNNWFE